MRIAEALLLRADYQTRLAQLKERLRANALRRADEDASVEDPDALLDEYRRLTGELSQLVARIALTNATQSLDGRPFAEWLAERERLSRTHKMLTDLANAASQREERSAWGIRGDVRYKPTVNVAALRSEADAIARELRDLNVRLQQANWSTDLV